MAQTIPSSIANPTDTAVVAPPVVDTGVPASANQTGTGYGALSGYATNGVNGRARPGFDSVGLPVGGFRLYPSVTISGFYDSNIYALPSATSGGGAIIAPQASLVSDWTRHSLSISVNSAVDLYANANNSNSETITGSASGRFDVDSSTQLFPTLSIGRKVEPRGSEYSEFNAPSSPIFYREISGGLNAQHRFGDLLVNIGGTFSQDRFEDVIVGSSRVSLQDNNSETDGANARVQYTVGPGLGVFVSGSYNAMNLQQSLLYPDRNSNGYSILGGVAFGVTRLLTGEIGVGYLHQSFAYAGYGNVSGLDYSAKLDWSPTQLLDLHVNLGRSFQQTVIINAGGIQLDSLTGSIDYELRRNLLIGASLGIMHYNYRGINLTVQEYVNNYTVRYLMNRHLSLVGTLNLSRQRPDSSAAQFGREFDRAVASLGVRIQ